MIMIMGKIYQPIVIEQVENLISSLEESDFFIDYEINDLTFVRQHLSDILTEKFIDGVIDGDFEELFSEEEFEQLLKELVAGSILYELKEKGIINSYEDENTEETFFLTEEGKEYIKNEDKKD